MKRVLLPLFQLGFLLGLVFIFQACSHKSDDPLPSSSPFGYWIRTFTGSETYHAQLNISVDGTMAWIMLDTLSTHTNSYAKVAVNGDQIRFYDDPDLPGDGIYKWSAFNGVLTLTVISDNYPARVRGISGSWQGKEPAAMQMVEGAWQKNMVVNGISYRVKMNLTFNGGLNWTMTDSIPGHSNSYVSFTATGSTMVIFKDKDCTGNGYYSYVVNKDALVIRLIKDACEPRSPSFAGDWFR